MADWVRGKPKLGSGTSREWRDWRREAKSQHPVRYWIAEEGLDRLQNFIWWPVDRLYDVKYYINNRWVTRTHQLTAHPRDIPPGEWRDVGNRFLPCLFNELVDFVEIEQAWHHIAWDEEAHARFAPPWWASGWFRWRTWRCPEAGLAYLSWASSLVMDESWGVDPTDERYGKFTPQALAAREIVALYRWWKDQRPTRPDPMEASGWSDYCARRRQPGGDVLDILDHEDETQEQQAESRRILEVMHKMEEEFEKEDEDMMIRLIKIRQSLWT